MHLPGKPTQLGDIRITIDYSRKPTIADHRAMKAGTKSTADIAYRVSAHYRARLLDVDDKEAGVLTGGFDADFPEQEAVCDALIAAVVARASALVNT